MKILALILTLFLVSCSDDNGPQPETVTQTSNPDYRVALLFEKDGCKVYRFYDTHYYRYFTNCTGKVTSEVNCGKSCVKTEEIETTRGN